MVEKKRGLISVIIPVYNVEKYLADCLDSILCQTYQNFEIILINDGSKDASGRICEEYAQKDERFKVIHKDNAGVSSARNDGLDVAEGEYITFVDSDDIIEPEMLEQLVKGMDDKTDIVECECYTINTQGEKCPFRFNPNAFYGTIDDTTKILIACFDGTIKWALWAKLYKSKLITDVRFERDLRLGEDGLFVVSCCHKSKQIRRIPYVGYGYAQRVSSVMHEKLNEKQWDTFKAFERMKIKCQKEQEVIPYIARMELKSCRYYIGRILYDGVYKEQLKVLRKKVIKNKDYIYHSGLFSRFDKYFTTALRFIPHLLYFFMKIYLKTNSGQKHINGLR